MEIFCMVAGCWLLVAGPDSSFPLPGYGGSESNLVWMKVLHTFVQNPDTPLPKTHACSRKQVILPLWPLGSAPPASYRLDHAERHQAKPEVHHQPEIDLEAYMVRSGRQIPHQQKVGCV